MNRHAARLTRLARRVPRHQHPGEMDDRAFLLWAANEIDAGRMTLTPEQASRLADIEDEIRKGTNR
ncbi:hypothetical protein [Georgenia daeguensis]|uniref:DUF2934 domain-containing protein n=1 Tax=Georgenia daeguensis TaxID=908355 RepID=A0ABP8EQK5_9MICO